MTRRFIALEPDRITEREFRSLAAARRFAGRDTVYVSLDGNTYALGSTESFAELTRRLEAAK